MEKTSRALRHTCGRTMHFACERGSSAGSAVSPRIRETLCPTPWKFQDGTSSTYQPTSASRMATNGNAQRTAQVRIHLKTKYGEIELPQETGPILVSTGTHYHFNSKNLHS